MVKKRKIFYISGFDPRGFRFYRETLKDSITNYQEKTNHIIDVRTDNNQIIIKNQNEETENIYSFLGWDDIVRNNWEKNPIKLGLKTIETYALYLRYIDWKKAFKLSYAPIITLLFPLITLILIWGGFSTLLNLIPIEFPFKTIISIAISFLPSVFILDKIKSLWLLRFFIFNAKAFGDHPEMILPRLQEFKEKICKSIEQDYDEIQIISHSNGSILIIPLLEMILSENIKEKEKLKILTLGQCIPLASLYYKSNWFHDKMKSLSNKKFTWMDLGSPADGVCYCLQNPLIPYDKSNNSNILYKSPQFHKYYPQKDYKKLRRNKFKIHFAYLETSPEISPWDIVYLMTSNKSLETSFNTKLNIQYYKN